MPRRITGNLFPSEWLVNTNVSSGGEGVTFVTKFFPTFGPSPGFISNRPFLACTFCSPISGQVATLLRTFFFQISNAKAYSIKRKRKNSLEDVTWSEMGKQHTS